jgi:hypothetical protein
MNLEAAYFMVDIRTENDKTFGYPDLSLCGRSPSVLFVREDWKNITSQQIEAFYVFCRSEVAKLH